MRFTNVVIVLLLLATSSFGLECYDSVTGDGFETDQNECPIGSSEQPQSVDTSPPVEQSIGEPTSQSDGSLDFSDTVFVGEGTYTKLGVEGGTIYEYTGANGGTKYFNHQGLETTKDGQNYLDAQGVPTKDASKAKRYANFDAFQKETNLEKSPLVAPASALVTPSKNEPLTKISYESKPIKLADGTQIIEVKGTNGIYSKFENSNPVSGSYVDAQGKPIQNVVLSTDNTKLEVTTGDKKYSVAADGKVYDSNNKELGKEFTYLSGEGNENNPKSAQLQISTPDGTAVILEDGTVVPDAKGYPNGAYEVTQNGNKEFVDRYGNNQGKEAFSDGHGGYYKNTPNVQDINGQVTLHHFANGQIYGEQDSIIDSKYVYGMEDSGGSMSTQVYDTCVVSEASTFNHACLGPDGSVEFPMRTKDSEGFDKYKSVKDNEVVDEEKLFQDSFGIGGFGMRHFGDSVDQWVGATSGRYFSLFYSDYEADYYLALKENQLVSMVLGGIEGVSGELCKLGVMDLAGSGGTFSPDGGAGYAFINAQRSSFVNVTNPTESLHEYVISMTVDPAKCDMMFIPTIANTKTGVKFPILLNVPFLQKGNESFTFRAVIPSRKLYDQVCLEFTSIPSDCLAGVSEQWPICNTIPSGEEIVAQEDIEELQEMIENQITEVTAGFGLPFQSAPASDAVPATSGPVTVNQDI